jgi:predicted flap endonuclease-1-like 5' DNA nuclease
VRSEALRAPAAEARPGGTVEDLKRIRGIGVLIEKKLNSMGVVSYDQIANWSSQDIDRISQVLDFKGRIERENWVEQARILASGGQTEFSRRVDRGEVDSSRGPKP